jgi:hypothetical protein
VYILDQKLEFAFVGWVLLAATGGLLAAVHHALRCAQPCKLSIEEIPRPLGKTIYAMGRSLKLPSTNNARIIH